MAVPIEFCSVILRKAHMAASFPGGLDAFFSFCNAGSYIEDDRLVRVAFMATYEAEAFVERVTAILPSRPVEGPTCAVLDSTTKPSQVGEEQEG